MKKETTKKIVGREPYPHEYIAIFEGDNTVSAEAPTLDDLKDRIAEVVDSDVGDTGCKYEIYKLSGMATAKRNIVVELD